MPDSLSDSELPFAFRYRPSSKRVQPRRSLFPDVVVPGRPLAALKKSFEASGKTRPEFADMLGMNLADLERALKTA